MTLTTEILLNALIDSGAATPMTYSGRGMYGAKCLAARVEGCLVEFGASLQRSLGTDFAVPSARIDNLGRDAVVYWPALDDKDTLARVKDDT